MTRFVRMLSLLAVLALSLAPLAAIAANCADRAAASELATMPDMPCCPTDDEPAEPMACKVGCIQVTAVVTLTGTSIEVPLPTYQAAATASHAEWLTPPDTDPPKANLRS